MTTEKFKPTEEELFDFHLGITDPQLSRQIESYLEQDAEAAAKIAEFSRLEKAFEDYPLDVPSERVLQRVRENAERCVRTPWYAFLFTKLPVRRSVAWMAMIFVVVGLSVALKELRQSQPHLGGQPFMAKDQNAADKNLKAAAFTATDEDSAVIANPQIDVVSDAQKDLNQAVMLWQQSQYEGAAKAFEVFVQKHPDYKDLATVYGYWAESLEKAGHTEDAQAKRMEQERLIKLQEGSTPMP